MAMKALITGREGFVGKYLDEQLKGSDIETFGYDLRNGQNLLDYEQIRNAIDKIRPDYIYHLAAQAFVPESFNNPRRTIEVNSVGSLNLLEAVRQLGLKSKILLASTSEVYGDGSVSEDSLPSPQSPYAISKLAMEHLGQIYTRSYGMHIVTTRTFNHTGAGRGEMYAESSFAKQIAQVEINERRIIEHGNLSSKRNFTDVRDVVRAYQLVIDCPPDIYNVCSKTNVTIDEVLTMLCDLSPGDIDTKVNPELYRPTDVSFNEPECSKLVELTGWQPQIPFRETLREILDYWRYQL